MHLFFKNIEDIYIYIYIYSSYSLKVKQNTVNIPIDVQFILRTDKCIFIYPINFWLHT